MIQKKFKVVAFYFTQSGQALIAAKHICAPLEKACNVIYKRIIPQHEYPFPWTTRAFFDAFPESRLGQPPSGIAPIDFSDVVDADLVLVVGQSWFLAPSLPLQSFFIDEQVKTYLQGRDVVFVNVCRNMWVMTLRSIREYIKDANARLIGHIVLQDAHPNLISAITVVRWLIRGRKQSTTLLPASGIADKEMSEAARFGDTILKSLQQEAMSQLPLRLMSVRSVVYKPSIAFIEKTGHCIFGHWARFIKKKGDMGNPRRRVCVVLFSYYLTFVLFVMSPLAQFFFYLTYPFRNIRRVRQNDCRLNSDK
ncbi:MAG: hypothetical protein J5610_01560 [Prevotella sp.]|nr:hypothetical protein [Prevotella sp.]